MTLHMKDSRDKIQNDMRRVCQWKYEKLDKMSMVRAKSIMKLYFPSEVSFPIGESPLMETKTKYPNFSYVTYLSFLKFN